MSRASRQSLTLRSFNRLLGTTALAGMTLLPQLALAAADNWVGSTSSDWYTAGNWSTAVPTGADAVTIATIAPNTTLIDGGFAAAGSLHIGAGGGAGTLAIQNAAHLTSSSGTLSWDPNSAGTVTVSGANSRWSVSNLLSVGYAATSTMTVSAGGFVADDTGKIGDTATGNGTVTVTGTGSQWSSATALEVGTYGTGKLIVSSGGLVSAQSSTVALHTGSTGDVTVSGTGSYWHNTSSLMVGGGGTGTVTVNAGAHVDNGVTTTIGGSSTGVGTVTVTGIGSQMSDTTLVVGDFGNGTLKVLAGGVVNDLMGAGIIGANVSSQGAVTVVGSGSSWTVQQLVVGDAGTGTLAVSNSGALLSAVTYLGFAAGGTGTVTVTGAGSTWTVGNLIVGSAGSGNLTISNGGSVSSSGPVSIASGSGTGTVIVTGAGSTWTVANLTVGSAGNGNLTISNNGLVTSTTGPISVASGAGSTGTLNIGAAVGAAAVAPGSLSATAVQFGAGTGTINFNHTAANYVFSAAISGVGTVHQLAGHTSLTGTSTYGGSTIVDGGTLSVNGWIVNSMTTVNAGGTLGGDGVVGNTIINGGALAPGNSIGTLTVQGNLSFTAAASYMIEVSPASADRTNVTGTATLGGATVNASFAAGTYIAKQYTILNAGGGVSGTFGSLANTNLPSGFKSSLSYDTYNVYLNLDLNLSSTPGSNPQNGGLNVNQQNVANALTTYFNTNGGIQAVFGALSPAGLTQVSGETAVGSQRTTFDAMTQFMGVMTDPFMAGRGDAASSSYPGASQFADESEGGARSGSAQDAYAAMSHKAPIAADALASRWSVWTAGFGGSQITDGNVTMGTNTATSRVYGAAVGADYRLSPDTLAGFAVAGGGTNFGVANQGTGRSDLFQAGAFVRHAIGSAYLSGALAYGWQDITTDRTVAIAGIDQLRAKFNANAFAGRFEAGNRYATSWAGLTPYAAVQFTTFDLPAYAEQVVSGANTFALNYASKSVTATRSELGLRTDKSFAVNDAILTLRGRAAWAHDYNSDRNIAATFQTLPGAPFVVNGAAQAHDAALTTASAEMKWLNGFSLAATFEGDFSEVTRSYAGKGIARYSW
jgi:T5SS/PEP-CTERM-associated repeat protein/autotransporter-associated beta strand protein